jgi:hypothetical protein
MNTLDVRAKAVKSNYRVQWRKSLLLRREGAIGGCEDLARLWHEAFPKHDFWSQRLKRTDPLAKELWRQAAREYHHARGDRLLIIDNIAPEHAKRLRRLIAEPSISFNRLYFELNDPRRRPTPQVLIEAIWQNIRESGPQALKERADRERLAECDSAARAELDHRLARMRRKT